jgi:hypothetical protein
MNDLRSRLDALAHDATADIELRNPRTVVGSRRRSLRAWLTAVVASLLAALAVFTGGDLIINTGSSTDVRTVEAPQTTDSARDPDATTGPNIGTPNVEDGEIDSPTGTGGAPVGPSTIETRYGALGPNVAVAPNEATTGTAGSGCEPGDDLRLPDGVWMVNVTAFTTTALTVDVVCYSTNDSSDDVSMDFEITNDSTQTRTVALAGDASFYLQTIPPVRSVVDPETEIRAFGDPAGAAAFADESGDPTPLAWVLVEDGRIIEVYSPPLSSA